MIQNILDFLQNTPVLSPGIITILICVGCFVGFVNTIAGMATVISYGLFMAMGLPINIANGTTRVGVLAQFLVSSLIFKKGGYLNLSTGFKVSVPIAFGSIVGAFLASVVDIHIMEITKGILLPIMAILLFLNNSTISKRFPQQMGEDIGLWKFLAFVVIGFYGGFTHAGVGLLIIFGAFYLLGMDLIHSNAIKQIAVLIYTSASIIVFIIYNQINWEIALIYAVGNVIGGVLGSIVSIKLGNNFIKGFVLITVLLMSFWFIYKQFI